MSDIVGLKLPNAYAPTDNPLVLKPVYGTVGSQYARFFIHEEYSSADSVQAQMEVKRKVEICEIQNDRFTRVPIRVKDLSPEQSVALAPIYEQFKSQKDSNDTDINSWEAITDLERQLLNSIGIRFVEQIHNMPQTEVHRMGPYGPSLKERAAWHMAAKGRNPLAEAKAEVEKAYAQAEENRKELELLRKERESQALRLKDLEDAYYRNQATKASEEAPTKKKRGPRPQYQEAA